MQVKPKVRVNANTMTIEEASDSEWHSHIPGYYHIFCLIVDWFVGMLRNMARSAYAGMIIISCAVIVALTPDECNWQKYKWVSNIFGKLEKCCNLLVVYLQKVLVCPKSWPMDKFKKPKHMVKSYWFQTAGHCWSALMMAHLLVASVAMRHGLNLLHFDAESVLMQIDNCCLRCITNDVHNMVPSMIKVTMKIVRGFLKNAFLVLSL